MKLRHLSIFKIVCEEESITKAAERLSMTQPAISHTISELEETLGTQLFDRVSRKVYLNEIGKLFLSKVIPLLDLYDDLEESSKELENLATIRIGSSITIAQFQLPGIIERFHHDCAETPITVTIGSSHEIKTKLIHNELDFALVEGVVAHDQLVKIPFSSNPLTVICAPCHEFASCEPITMVQLSEEPLLLRETGSAIRDTFDSAMLLQNISVMPHWSSTDSYALIQAVKHNLGISVLPRILVEHELETGELAEVPVQDFEISCVNHVVFHKDKYQTVPFQTLINLVLF